MKKIPFEVLTLPIDEEVLDAVHAAHLGGVDPQLVFKTIVMVNEQKHYFVFCVPADRSISVKIARQLTNSKSLELVKLSEIQAVTGYIRGGCSPIGMKRLFPTYIDESAFALPFIYVSAGKRGYQVRLNADNLLTVVDGIRSEITSPGEYS